jgi:desulfoferrodoxin (superoxide reductase-like protein)
MIFRHRFGEEKEMFYRTWRFLLSVCLMMVLALCTHALANKTAVSIEAPAEVSKGSEVVIRATAAHNADNPLHYTEWLYVMVNGKEVARWDYTALRRPEAETFSKEVKHMATENLEIRAEGSCNLHGSAGPAIFRISVRE